MVTYVIRDGELVQKHAVVKDTRQIMPDIKPYKSMIDGHMVTSRSHHRTHLRDHDCIEVGNESMETKLAPPSKEARRRALHEQLSGMTDNDANRILSRLRDEAHNQRR